MTREKAKNWLNKLYVRADITDEYGDMVDMQPYSEAVDMAIEALEQTMWIPVSERLPEEYDLYLVYTEEQPFVCPFENGEFFIDDVVAWMPLPQPYKGESEDK